MLRQVCLCYNYENLVACLELKKEILDWKDFSPWLVMLKIDDFMKAWERVHATKNLGKTHAQSKSIYH